MTPEQINAVTNAGLNIHAFLDKHGPELLAAAIPGLGWLLIRRRHRKHTWRRDGIRHLEKYANHPGARRLLDDIHNQPREEEL